MQSRFIVLSFWLAVGLLIAACSPDSSAASPTTTIAATRAGQLTAFVPLNPTSTSQPAELSSPTPLPSPTATPQTHTVQKGEDLFGISLFYGVPLEEIIAANPTVNPRAMSIGTELIIPAALTPQPTTETGLAAIQQTPTPIPAEVGKLTCTRNQEGGIWCFQLVRNQQAITLEGVTGLFRLVSSDGGAIFSQTAFLPLDTLAPGAALPLISYFSPDVAANLIGTFHASSEIISSLPNPDDGRYIASHLENQKVMISANGLSADISLDVLLDQQGAAAGRIWVAATAYDASGSVVGARRWERQGEKILQSGQVQPVQMRVYSVAGPINQVEMVSEVRP